MFKNFWKNNGSFIIFAFIVVFASGTFYVASVQSSTSAKDLVAFADSSVPEIRGRFNNIQNLTTGVDASDQNYDLLIDEISSLSDKSLSLALAVPSKNTDQESKALSDNLKAFLLKVKSDTSDPLLSKVKLEKELFSDFNQYAKIRDLTATGGSTSEAKKILASAENILAKNIEYQKTIKNEAASSGIKKENEELEVKVSKIKEIFGNFENTEITLQQKTDLLNLYAGSYPNPKKFITIIQIGALESEDFAKDISALQQQLFKVKNRYSL